jgi:hypothetical protein
MTYKGGIHLDACPGVGCGTVFELSPRGDGNWTETILHSFNFNGADGMYPAVGLVFDTHGNLYGDTSYGGIHYDQCIGLGCGTIFELSPRGGGGWTERILHSFNFNGTDGIYPLVNVLLDSAGNIYGTTQEGGSHGEGCGGVGCGTVFEITP